jgi:hypothetical protein
MLATVAKKHDKFTIVLSFCAIKKSYLFRFNVKHVMYTTMLGVNEDYRRHGYYEKIIDLVRK